MHLPLVIIILVLTACGRSSQDNALISCRGTITDPFGQPVEGASIRVYEIWVNPNLTGNNEGFTEKIKIWTETDTDKEGHFETQIPFDRSLKQVSISKDGYKDKNSVILIESMQHADSLRFQIEPLTLIPGIFRDEHLLIKHD